MFRNIVFNTTFFILFSSAKLVAQNIDLYGTPYIESYPKSAYNAGNQNWSISVSPDRQIYVANTNGLLRYDGRNWTTFTTKNLRSLRSVNCASDGKIYTGGSGEFGYWENLGLGRLKYHSLSDLVQDRKILENDEIWRILIVGDKIYFNSFSKIYVYQQGNISTITANGEPFLFAHQVNNKLFFEQIPSGLVSLENNGLLKKMGSTPLFKSNILCMLPLPNRNVLIGTANDGLFRLTSTGEIIKWNNEADQSLKTNQINNGIVVGKDRFAFGTIQNGVFILDINGKLIQHINKYNGLQNNTVLSLSTDHQQNLWVGLDNGIDRIDISAPITYYSDPTGQLGTVYCTSIINGNIYLGTNKGLFVSHWMSDKKLDFGLVPNTQGQVWSLEIIKGKLYCGHNTGTFLIDGKTATLLSKVTGGWTFEDFAESDIVLEGNYTGLSAFSTKESTLKFIRQYTQLKEPIRYLLKMDERRAWIGNNSSLKQITFSADFQSIKEVETDMKGLGISPIHGIYKLGKSDIIATEDGFYRYDDITNEWKKYDALNSTIGTFQYANKIQRSSERKYWIFKDSRIAKLEFADDGKITIDSTSLASLNGKMMGKYENVFTIHTDLELIGLDDGFALFNPNATQIKDISTPIITGFKGLSTEFTPPASDRFAIPNRHNSVRISYSLPSYAASKPLYKVRLLGLTDEWSDWQSDSYRDFTNLSYGDYVFEVQAITAAGEISKIQQLNFSVERPWYLSWPAILVYLITIVLLIYNVRAFTRRKYLNQQKELERKMQLEREVEIKKEKERNERHLIEIKNEKLERELEIKKRELSNSATNIVYKNEMLNKLHDELRKIKDSNGQKLDQDQLKKVDQIIDEAHKDERDWNLFEESFNESHENFFKKLKSDYPDLVPNDLKLCAYLRLNMSSKEMASLLNISIRGVEIRRYRLRKKFNLPTSKNLSEFLLEL